MKRIIAIDYGTVRVGIAVTDPLQLIATGLDTVPTKQIMEFMIDYLSKEPVECIVVGDPGSEGERNADISAAIQSFVEKLGTHFPSIPIHRVDERFTSRMASRAMIDGGVRKMKRRDKSLIDKISATLILQTFLEMKKNNLFDNRGAAGK